MMLELRGVSAGYGPAPVLHDIGLSIRQGTIVSLVGANGAGKSTLLSVVSGLLRPMAGAITFDGRAVHDSSPGARLRLGIAHVPEGRQVFAAMTVAENLALGGQVARHGAAVRLAEACATFPMLHARMNDAAGHLSGGQQQMLAIARGLMSGPRLLLLDEPSLGLAPLLVEEVFRLIRGLRDRGLTILLAEQNARAALAIADVGHVVENGRIVLSGAAPDLLASPEIAERYLGGRPAADVAPARAAAAAARLRACIA